MLEDQLCAAVVGRIAVIGRVFLMRWCRLDQCRAVVIEPLGAGQPNDAGDLDSSVFGGAAPYRSVTAWNLLAHMS
ncbi:hypothetical protein ABZ412_27755 [Nocardia sp. NPDC005746]|uniref:hypothetical protein n=1 Tax=Nocardia sp. NPDC005746 TaxID=3157062 RepID=UPI0033C25046